MKEQKIVERIADRTLRCMLCKKLILTGSKFLDKEGFISCTTHREWLEKVVVPVTSHRYQYKKRKQPRRREDMLKPETNVMYEVFGRTELPDTDEEFRSEVNGVTLHDTIMELLHEVTLKRSFYPNFQGARYVRAVVLRFGLESPDGKGMTYREVAEDLGVCKERIRQMVARIFRMLRHHQGQGSSSRS